MKFSMILFLVPFLYFLILEIKHAINLAQWDLETIMLIFFWMNLIAFGLVFILGAEDLVIVKD